MVFHVEPVTDILPLAIDGQRATVADVVDEERYQFLGELIWPVIVAAIRHDRRHPVGVMERPDKMVARCLARRVRAVRGVLGVFGEKAVPIDLVRTDWGCHTLGMCQLECAVDFIGGYVVKTLAVIPFGQRLPIDLCGLQQGERPHDVCPGKCEWVFYRPVHVALGRKVDYAVDGVLPHEREHGIIVADVPLDKCVVGLVLDITEVCQVAGVGQFVEIDDVVVGIGVDEKADDMAAYEACPAGDHDVPFIIAHLVLLLVG